MQRASRLLGLAVALALCGCGGSSRKLPAPAPNSPTATAATARRTSSPAPRSPAASPIPDPAITARLQGALLTLADMPPGWTASTLAAGGGATSTDLCGVPSVESLELGTSEADFLGGDLGPFFTEELAQIAPGSAKSQLDALARALPGCQPQTEAQADGSLLTYTTTPLNFPSLGEQTVAVRLKVDGSLLPIQGNAIFIRRANSVAIVTLLAVGLAGPDAALTEMLARRADAKFAAVAR